MLAESICIKLKFYSILNFIGETFLYTNQPQFSFKVYNLFFKERTFFLLNSKKQSRINSSTESVMKYNPCQRFHKQAWIYLVFLTKTSIQNVNYLSF